MGRDKYLKREMIYSMIFVLIGLSALIGYVLGFEKPMMSGLAVGFIPTGAGMLILYQIAKKHPRALRNLQLEKEERNIYINTKAGHTAFWISYWYIFIALVFSNVLKVSMQKFSIFTLILMPCVYFLVIAIYHRKY